MIEFTARIVEASPKVFAVATPYGLGPAVEDVAKKCGAGYVSLRLTLPHRPRTTGARSQNSGIHGWFSDIAMQLGCDAERVKEAMKRFAVSEGYPPVYNPVDDAVEPKPTHEASVEEISILIKVTHRFADEHGMWLTEYVNDVPRKCIGGVPMDDI